MHMVGHLGSIATSRRDAQTGAIGVKPQSRGHGLHKRPRKLKRQKVLNMLAVMETQQVAGPSNSNSTAPVTPECATVHTQEFLSSGRTGRRNALPDILGEHALVTSSDLPARLQSLSTAEPIQGPSKDSKSEAGATAS